MYTTGPWKFKIEDSEWAIVTDKWNRVIANVNAVTAPTISTAPNMAKMPMLGNAGLIAAAPELLEACVSALPFLQVLGESDDNPEVQEIIEKVQNIISKAKEKD